MIELVSEDTKEELIKQFRGLPTWIVACAFVYAVGLNKFGVDVSKEWKTVTEKRSELDLAYRRGRRDEQERWAADKEDGE